MNDLLLKGIGIGVCSTFGSLLLFMLFLIKYFDKVCLFIATLSKPLSFIEIISKNVYALRLQSTINDICQNLSPEIFQRRLKVKWLKKAEIDQAFSTDSVGEITVHVIHERNPNKVAVNILKEYTSISFIPNLRSALDRSFIVANELYIMSKVIGKKRDDALFAYYDNYLQDSSDNETKRLLQTIYTIDKDALYFSCFLNALSCVDRKAEHYMLYDKTVQEEATKFTDFFYNIATKEASEETELLFTGRLFKVNVILVAKEETLNIAGLQPHINRVEWVMRQMVDRIYLVGRGIKNVTNVKRLATKLKQFKYLNGIAPKTYIIEGPDGKSQQYAIGVYENYFYERAKLEKSQQDEIIDLLNTYIPEVNDGSIEILKVAREKGVMTKVLVKTDYNHINVIGCCVGTNFKRKNSIELALAGEKIYFVEYSNDEETLVQRSLSPFRDDKIEKCEINFENKTVIVVVKEGQYGWAVGIRGTNVKLASQLIDWRIEISKSFGGVSGNEVR